jgi:hypothetical protein
MEMKGQSKFHAAAIIVGLCLGAAGLTGCTKFSSKSIFSQNPFNLLQWVQYDQSPNAVRSLIIKFI